LSITRRTSDFQWRESGHRYRAVSGADAESDVLLEADFVSALVQAGQIDKKAGDLREAAVATSISIAGQAPSIPRGSTLRRCCGIWLRQPGDRPRALPEARVCVRGNGGGGIYRRKMILDIAVDGEFFDADFFVYREDADVAWRAQLLGWRCTYRTRVLPCAACCRETGALPSAINMHSVKNRFLMRIKNITPACTGGTWCPSHSAISWCSGVAWCASNHRCARSGMCWGTETDSCQRREIMAAAGDRRIHRFLVQLRSGQFAGESGREAAPASCPAHDIAAANRQPLAAPHLHAHRHRWHASIPARYGGLKPRN
jgi:hypothetical protein